MSDVTIQTYDGRGNLLATRTEPLPVEVASERTVEDDLRAALDRLATLVGQTSDPAGTTSLRAIKNTTNATINAGPALYIKALADALILVARNQRKQIRAEVRDFAGTD